MSLVGCLEISSPFLKMLIPTIMVPLFFSVPLGAIGYLLLLPVAVVMRIHFYTINLTLPSGNTELVKSIADRVDLPWIAHFLRKVNNGLPLFFDCLGSISFITISYLMLTGLGQYNENFKALAYLILVRLLILPLLKYAVESRITLLTTFQNRLIASSKQAKNSHQ